MAGYVQDRKDNESRVQIIKSKVSIPDYFEQIIVPARQNYYSGYNTDLWSGHVICPLHDEDTPSFSYKPDAEIFKCFGCGASGDVISLHQQFIFNETGERVSFADALKFLERVFIKGQEITETDVIKTTVSRDLNKFTYMNSIYQRILHEVAFSKKSVAEKNRIVWETRALRELAYAKGDYVVEQVSKELRQIHKSL